MRERDLALQPAADAHRDRFQWGLDRFMAEAQTLARFKHPNIVRVLAVFEANRTGYMVMEYEQGDTLHEILTGRNTLDEAKLLSIVLTILGGLEKVHERGFIHRDIKPANIFIREDRSPVLIDFGSARQALGAETRGLTTLVSPGYAPFEQYFSKGEQQGPWTDIYGLGATLYRAVTGRPPQDALQRSQVLHEAARDTLGDVREIGQGRYSAPFLKAIDHALQFRQKDRPQTVAEWRREFAAAPDAEAKVKARDSAMTGTTIPAAEPLREPPNGPRTQPASPTAPAGRMGLVLDQLGAAVAAWANRHEDFLLRIYRGINAIGEVADWVENFVESARNLIGNLVLSLLGAAVVVAALWAYNNPTAVSEWVATGSSGQGQGEDIATLLSEAQADLDALRLTAPAGDNALEKYRKVLELAPDNITARQGLQNIAERQKRVDVDRQALDHIIKYLKQKREQQSKGLKK